VASAIRGRWLSPRATRSSISRTGRVASRRSIRTRRTSASSSSRTCPTAGPIRTRPGTAESTTSGSPPRAGAGLDAAHFWGWGDDAYIGNYGDNSLLYFHQYQSSQPGSPLFEGALTGTNISQNGTLFDRFKQDIAGGKLPQVSWIVAPEAYTEHPNWPANYGAWYVSQMLDALTSNPEVWSKTVFFLMYDENDGFFDHMVPPTPPQSRAQGLSTVDTTNEVFAGNSQYAAGPYGLGVSAAKSTSPRARSTSRSAIRARPPRSFRSARSRTRTARGHTP